MPARPGARDGVHRDVRVVTRRQGEVRVVLAPRRVAGKEPSHSAISKPAVSVVNSQRRQRGMVAGIRLRVAESFGVT